MILIGDIGNTDTKFCLLNKNYKIIKKIVLPTNKINKSTLLKSFNFLLKNKFTIKKSLFCSVVPKKFFLIKFFVQNKLKSKCSELKEINLSKFMKINVNRKQIGSDRLANALAVISEKKNYIILDFGTATTFDVVNRNIYNGGIIAPGLNMSLSTLIKKATLIPKINLKKIKKVVGTNTVSAVRSGFFWGYVGLINNIIRLIHKETNKSFKIIATGGFSNLFKNSLDFKITVDKEITLKGIIKIIKFLDY